MGWTDTVRAHIEFATALVGSIPGFHCLLQPNEKLPSGAHVEAKQDPTDTLAATTVKDDTRT